MQFAPAIECLVHRPVEPDLMEPVYSADVEHFEDPAVSSDSAANDDDKRSETVDNDPMLAPSIQTQTATDVDRTGQTILVSLPMSTDQPTKPRRKP
jgi:hypothetical protein